MVAQQWPQAGESRVPNWIYTDPEIFAREQERIFEGPNWLYVCLEAEIPNPRRLHTQPAGHARGRRGAWGRRRGAGAGQQLRPSQHAVLQR
jgi:hypothetical protein